MEKDDEWNQHQGAHYTTDYRQYDPRLGRWTSIDPVVKPYESGYAGFENNPIYYADPSGLDGEARAKEYQKKHGGEVEQSPYRKSTWWVNKNGKDEDGNPLIIGTKRFDDYWYEKAGKWIGRVASKVGQAISTAVTIYGVLSGFTAFDNQMKEWGKNDDDFLKGHYLYNPKGATIEHHHYGGIESQSPNGKTDNALATTGITGDNVDEEVDKTGYVPGSIVGAEHENPFTVGKVSKASSFIKGHTIEPFSKGVDVIEKGRTILENGNDKEVNEEVKKIQYYANGNINIQVYTNGSIMDREVPPTERNKKIAEKGVPVKMNQYDW